MTSARDVEVTWRCSNMALRMKLPRLYTNAYSILVDPYFIISAAVEALFRDHGTRGPE